MDPLGSQIWYGQICVLAQGLIRNDLYIPRLIGRPGSVIEALPIETCRDV